MISTGMRFTKVKDKVFDNGTFLKKTLIEEKAVMVVWVGRCVPTFYRSGSRYIKLE